MDKSKRRATISLEDVQRSKVNVKIVHKVVNFIWLYSFFFIIIIIKGRFDQPYMYFYTSFFFNWLI